MRNIAVLIDAENVQASFADKVFSYANSIGNVIVKEIYGIASALGLWVEPVLKYAIHPNLTIKASKFKNTSDISLVIGAMDQLIAGNVDTVIIVSSDSDFSTLSVRLRSSGLEVIGMGTDKVNPLWRTACTSFVVLNGGQTQQSGGSQTSKPVVVVPVTQTRPVQSTAPAPKAVAVPVQPAKAVQAENVQKRDAESADQGKPSRQANQTDTQHSVPNAAQSGEGQEMPRKSEAPAAPVIVIPEEKIPKPPVGGSSKAQRPRAAATHADRAEAIRIFIVRQLERNGGKMAIPNLFHVLTNLPDYHVDQQGSKRKPLNYLMWTFSDTFTFSDGYISLSKPTDSANNADNRKETEQAAADSVQKDAPEAGNERVSAGNTVVSEAVRKAESDETHTGRDESSAAPDTVAGQADEVNPKGA